jgi:hypothetical protein
MLMAAALALPGMSALASDPNVRKDNVTLSYNHADYSESDKRMDVRVDQLSMTIPIGERFEIKANTIRDITSGASPFSNRLAAGKPVMILATAASIREQRDVVDVTGSYYGDEFIAGVNLGTSRENDYNADFASVNYRRFLNDKATMLTVGAAFSNDVVWEKYYPLAVGSKPSVYSDRRKHDLMVGVSQILDADSVVSLTVTHAYTYGNLNDQYRKAVIVTKNIPAFVTDTRPGDHTQWTALLAYSRYLEAIRSAMHVDYRFAHDSWGAHSHTVEGKLKVDLGQGWSVGPGLRYTTQRAADFYATYFTAMPAEKVLSTDYRLASFGAVSPKLEARKAFANGLAIQLAAEKYIRKHSYARNKGRGDAIDDYKATMFSLSVEGGF